MGTHSDRVPLRSRYGSEMSIAVDGKHGYFTFSGTSKQDATTTPTGGTWDADNYGVMLQAVTADVVVGINGVDPVVAGIGIIVYAGMPPITIPIRVSGMEVLRLAAVDGTIRWTCLIGSAT